MYIFLQCDGKPLKLGGRTLEGIAILNIPSIYGGSNLWGQPRNSTDLSTSGIQGIAPQNYSNLLKIGDFQISGMV